MISGLEIILIALISIGIKNLFINECSKNENENENNFINQINEIQNNEIQNNEIQNNEIQNNEIDNQIPPKYEDIIDNPPEYNIN
jgi:hypothetical protein